MITTLGIFKTHTTAEAALNELKENGIQENNLSYIYQNNDGAIKDAQSGGKVTTGAVVGATAGAVIGGIAALIIANGIIPGLGTLYVAGPLAVALGITEVTAATAIGITGGAIAGGLIGGLTKLGVDTKDAALYEEHIRSGNILVISQDTDKSTKDIFKMHDAMEVREYSQI